MIKPQCLLLWEEWSIAEEAFLLKSLKTVHIVCIYMCMCVYTYIECIYVSLCKHVLMYVCECTPPPLPPQCLVFSFQDEAPGVEVRLSGFGSRWLYLLSPLIGTGDAFLYHYILDLTVYLSLCVCMSVCLFLCCVSSSLSFPPRHISCWLEH